MRKTQAFAFHSALVFALTVLGPVSGGSEARAGIVSVGSDVMTFTSDSQSVWGPGEAIHDKKTFDLFEVPVPKTSVTLGPGIVSQWGGKFGGTLTASLGWLLDMNGSLSDFNTGTVSLKWPAVVTVTMNEPNSFAPGDTVTINSEYRIVGGGSLSTTPPSFKAALEGTFSVDASASLTACLGQCDTYNLFNVHPDPPYTFTLATLSTAGVSFSSLPVIGTYTVPVLPHLMTYLESNEMPGGLKGYVDFPTNYENLNGRTAAYRKYRFGIPIDLFGPGSEFNPDYTDYTDYTGEVYDIEYSDQQTSAVDHPEILEHQTSYKFVDLSLDLDSFADPEGLLGREIPPNPVGIVGSYNVLDVPGKIYLTYDQRLKFEPNLQVRVDFPREMTFKVAEGEWQIGDHAIFNVGQSLQLKAPLDQSRPWTHSTLYNLANNTFTSTTEVQAGATISYSAATVEVRLPSGNFTEVIVENVCDCWDLLPGEVCNWWNKTCRDVTSEISHSFPEVRIGPDGPLTLVDSKELAKKTITVPIVKYTGHLGGISPLNGPSFTLDPEDPNMLVQAEVSRVINHGGGRRTVVYTMAIDNAGDVPIKDLRIVDPLADAFAATAAVSLPATGLRSCDFTINSNFNTPAGGELLHSPIILDDGRDPNPGPVSNTPGGVITGGSLQVEVDVWPGLYPQPYLNSFKADGVSYLRGTPVVREAQAAVDLGPARLEKLQDFAVYADKKVLMKEPVAIKGSVGSNDAVEIQNGSNSMIAGDIHSLGTVDVHGAVTVDYVFTNSFLNFAESGRVNGHPYTDLPELKEVNQYVSPVMQRVNMPAVHIESTGPSLTITAKSTANDPYVLIPGEYGVVKVAAGAKVLLQSGENGSYSFREFDAEEGATILFDVPAPLAVNVAHDMKVGKKVKMDFQQLHGSTRNVNFNIGSQGEIRIGESAQLLGTWIAPSASITLGHNTHLKGAVYADMIKMEGGSVVEYHEEPWIGNLYKRYNTSCESKSSLQ